MIREHGNWIGGEWRPATDEQVFEVSAADSADVLGRWPRSSARDVASAVRLAQAGQASWAAWPKERRLALLERALAILVLDFDPDQRMARRIGLEPHELAPHLAHVAEALSHALATGAAEPSSSDGVHVLAPDWSEILHEPALALFNALQAGRSVLLLADARLPMACEVLASALERATLPAGVLALVHDDGDTCLRAALADPGIATVELSAHAARLRKLERLAQRAHGRFGPSARAESTAGFGAGLEESSGASFHYRLLRNRSHVVAADADPAAEALYILEHAFGRATALSGQRTGSIGRVICHQRLFSRFTTELLALLDRSPDAAHPLRAIDAEATAHMRRILELGLDEGATPIFCGEQRRSRPTAAVLHDSPTPAGHRADASLWPIVFTNADEHMRLAWSTRPAPVLCLLRVASDTDGRALAGELERAPPSEELSALNPARAAPREAASA